MFHDIVQDTGVDNALFWFKCFYGCELKSLPEIECIYMDMVLAGGMMLYMAGWAPGSPPSKTKVAIQ